MSGFASGGGYGGKKATVSDRFKTNTQVKEGGGNPSEVKVEI